MAKYVPTAITYQDSGLVKNRAPFVLSDDAYQTMDNCYHWRGRLKRRPGYDLLGRLRRNITAQSLTVADGSGTYTSSDILDGFRIAAKPETNASLAKGSVAITFDAGGNATTFTDDSAGSFTRTSGTAYDIDAGNSSINYITGIITIVFSGGPPGAGVVVAVSYGYYPSLPVMGLPTRELDAINAEQTIAFDTKYCYRFNNTSNQFEELLSAAATTWTGDDSNFFYTSNYWKTSNEAQYFWATNFSGSAGDPIRVYDGTSWFDFTPTTGGSSVLFQARIILPYKGRLVALNTYEGPLAGAKNHYPNRARYSQVGAPMSSVVAGVAPTAPDEWRDDIGGRGGYVDGATNEHIVAAEYIRDTLVVYFERSTWQLRYTGSEIQPFVWERINKELGAESTFSVVSFDEGVLAVGDKAITECNGNNASRIDDSIPDEVFRIHNNSSDGPLRVHGIRDFFERLVYWTFPNAASNSKFPDRVLVYNYQSKTWSVWRDSFTTFGRYQIFNDVTWGDLTDVTWSQANFSWVTARLQSQFPNLIAGNQQGFVEILNQKVSNDPSLEITAITGGANPVVISSPNHSLHVSDQGDNPPAEYIKISGVVGNGSNLNDRIFKVEVLTDDTFGIQGKPQFDITAITSATQAVVTAAGHDFNAGDKFCIAGIVAGMTDINAKWGEVVSVSGNDITTNVDTTPFTAYSSGGWITNLDGPVSDIVIASGTYLGCGSITRVMGFRARSKMFNFIEGGKKAFLAHVDFLSKVTASGEISCNIYNDYNQADPVNEVDDSFFNNSFSTEVEAFSTEGKGADWHRFYCPTDAQFFSYELTLKEPQIFCPAIVDSEVLIEAIIIYAAAGGRLVDG